MNVFTFTGNIGQDAETKYTKSGAPICSFSVAVNSGFGDRQRTSWIRCLLLGKRAEGGLPPYLVKGQKVGVSGELEVQEWDAQDGSKQKTVQVVVNQVDLLGDKQVSRQVEPERQAPQQPQGQAQGGYDPSLDEIPFAYLGRESDF